MSPWQKNERLGRSPSLQRGTDATALLAPQFTNMSATADRSLYETALIQSISAVL